MAAWFEYYGRAKYNWGFDYKHSTGTDYKYSAGTSTSISISADTKISTGASYSINLGSLGGSFTVYDSKFSQHFGGASSGIETAYQKSYQDTFSIAISSTDPWLFKRIKYFSTGLILMSVGTMLSSAATVLPFQTLAKDEKKGIDEAKDIAAGWFAKTSYIASAVTAVVAAAGAVYMHVHKRGKPLKFNDTSTATIGLSKNSRAFLGVQNKKLASGLQFWNGEFRLAAHGVKDETNGAFARASLADVAKGQETKYARHGWEVVGFQDPQNALTEIKGDTTEIGIKSSDVRIWSEKDGLNDGEIHIGTRGVGDRGITIGSEMIGVDAKKELELIGGNSGDKGILKMLDKSVTLKSGAIGIKLLADRAFVVGGLVKDQSIAMNKQGVFIKNGSNDNSIVMNAAGMNLCNGAIKILGPTVMIKDIEENIKNQKAHLESQIQQKVKIAKDKLNEKMDDAIYMLAALIDDVQRTVETKII